MIIATASNIAVAVSATAAKTALIVLASRIADLLAIAPISFGFPQMIAATARTLTEGNDSKKRRWAACDAVPRPISILLMKAMQSGMM
jgi:hypothetical protein